MNDLRRRDAESAWIKRAQAVHDGLRVDGLLWRVSPEAIICGRIFDPVAGVFIALVHDYGLASTWSVYDDKGAVLLSSGSSSSFDTAFVEAGEYLLALRLARATDAAKRLEVKTP